MLHTGKQTWKARKSSLLQKDSKHQSQTDVFKLIWLSQGPHAIIYNRAFKEGGQDYCGVINPASAIETHVETLEMLCVKCKGAFWQMQLPPNEKSWFKLLKSNSCRKARALRWLQHGLLSPPASSFSSPRYAEAGHKIESIWVQLWKSPAAFCTAGTRSAAGWGGHRGVPPGEDCGLPCPWPWETPPCCQTNVNSSCSFPEEVFQPTLRSIYTRT